MLRFLIAVIVFGVPAVLMAASPIVLYTSVDEPVVRPIIARFEKETGLAVKVVTDGEAAKTAGLAAKLEAEKANPRCDVYWGNELGYAMNLANQGVFQPYTPAGASDIPAKWRGQDGLFTCIGLRARWLVVSTRPEHAAAVARIKSIGDLADPALKGKTGFCNPAFGTASGHFATLYTRLGEEKFSQLVQSLRDNEMKLLGGNMAVVREVGAGTLIAGVTDNDDVHSGVAQKMPVRGVALEGDDALLIPTTLALVKGAPSPESGKRLIDFLARPEVEKQMIESGFLVYSVRDPKVADAPMGYEESARNLRSAVESALRILQRR